MNRGSPACRLGGIDLKTIWHKHIKYNTIDDTVNVRHSLFHNLLSFLKILFVHNFKSFKKSHFSNIL